MAYPYNDVNLNNEVGVMKFDSTLGWIPKEGNYTFEKYHENGSQIIFDFMEDGRRITSSDGFESDREIIIVGGSYTQGWAISNNQTFAWKLQNKLKSIGIEVKNYGVGAYGTYQSLLMLERINKGLVNPPNLVIYGFFDHHDERNIASSDWMQAIYRDRKNLDTLKVPYVGLRSNGMLLRHNPEDLKPWYGRNKSSIIYFFEKLYLRFYLYKDRKEKEIITEKLILEMNKFVNENMNSKLLVAHLERWGYHDYRVFLNENKKINYLDCTNENINKPGWFVKGDGHPNEKMNEYWAKIIFNEIKDKYLY